MSINKFLLGALVISTASSSFAIVGSSPNNANQLNVSNQKLNATLELENLLDKPGAPVIRDINPNEYSIEVGDSGNVIVLTKKFIYIYEKNKWHAIKHLIPNIYNGASVTNIDSMYTNNIVVYNYNTQKIYLYNGIDWIISPAPFNRNFITNPRLFSYMLSKASINNISIVLSNSWWQYDGHSWQQPLIKGNAEFNFDNIRCENIGAVNNNVVMTKNNKLYIYDGQKWTTLPNLPNNYKVDYLNTCSNDYINNPIDNVVVFATGNNSSQKKEFVYNRKDNIWDDISYNGENEDFASPVVDKNIAFYNNGIFISHQEGNTNYRFIYNGNKWFHDYETPNAGTTVNIKPKASYIIDWKYLDRTLAIKNLETNKIINPFDTRKYNNVPTKFSLYSLNNKNQVMTLDREQNGGSLFIDNHWINLNTLPNYPKENFSLDDIKLFDNSAIITGRDTVLNEPQIFVLHF